MNAPKKCPITTLKQSQLWQIVGNFIDTIKNQVKNLSWESKLLTFQYANKHLWLINNKKEIDEKYANLPIDELSENLDHQHSNNQDEFDTYLYTMRMIEREISVYIYQQMVPEMIKINANDIDFHKYADVKEHFHSIPKELIDMFTKIADKILENLYKNIWDKKKTDRIYQITRIYLKKHQKTEVSDRLKSLLYNDGIKNTINIIFKRVEDFIEVHDKYDRNEIERFIKNDEWFWSQIGLSNSITRYLQKDPKRKFRYSKSENKTTIDYTEKEFRKIVKKYYKKMPEWIQKNTYIWCPLMYTKTKVDKKEMNGILAYQNIIYSLILDRIDAYKAYNRQKIED